MIARIIRHLPALLLFGLSVGWLLWYFRFSLASFDLRPWMLGIFAINWLVASAAISFVVRRLHFPAPISGYVSATGTMVLGSFLFFAVGWPLAETLAAAFREVRGVHSDLGNWYFYHDFSGMGIGKGFRSYAETLQTALVMTFLSGILSTIVAPLASMLVWTGAYAMKSDKQKPTIGV
ncbi:hypothetical protein [Verrucomicrobium spinosum]|nr:hypothetical protein [Verrucomicrobium spinosum]